MRRSVCNALTNSALFLCVLMVLSLAVTRVITGIPSIAGRFMPLWVPTGSMEPTIHAHSIVIAAPVKAEDVVPGDIIVYKRYAQPNTGIPIPIPFYVIHRLIAIDDHGYYIFQGDAEDRLDPPVNGEQIVYRMIRVT